MGKTKIYPSVHKMLVLNDFTQVITLGKSPTCFWYQNRIVNLITFQPFDNRFWKIHSRFVAEWETSPKTRIKFKHIALPVFLKHINIKVPNMSQVLA